MKLLVVEDHEGVRDVICEHLTQLGNEVHAARDGLEALAIVQCNPLDLILMDLRMPRMDGFTAVQHLRSDPRWADVLVLAFSCEADAHSSDELRALGFDGYITKPATLQQIAETIEQFVKKRRDGESGRSAKMSP